MTQRINLQQFTTDIGRNTEIDQQTKTMLQRFFQALGNELNYLESKGSGISGTFTDKNGKVVTVVNGSIVKGL